MVPRALEKLSNLATTVPFRLTVAALFLSMHAAVMVGFAASRYQQPLFSGSQPAPHYVAPSVEAIPHAWDRLVFSRWDSAHYISLSLRGYAGCSPQDLRGVQSLPRYCDFNYYPGYPALGWMLSRLTGLPADFSLLALSLLAGFVFLYLWTGPEIRERLGVWRTYLALLLFNLFPTGFLLVTISTEPCALGFTLAAFVAFARRRWVLAGSFAGAATAMRISGLATGVALALAVLVTLVTERPRRPLEWASRMAALGLSCWGVLSIMGYHYYRYRDPLLYLRAHSETFAHTGSLTALSSPHLTWWLLRSIDHPLHEGVALAFCVVWFLLGRRAALGAFRLPERVFWYGLAAGCFAISFFGSLELNLAWMSRYLLLVIPLFFAMATVMSRRPLLLGLWLWVSFWHYREVDLCDHLGGNREQRFTNCQVPQWSGRF
jgi:hypothetical protein